MTSASTFQPVPILARELGVSERSAAAAVELLSAGNTVPFIARYRKEATGGLDEVAIRKIEERHGYLVEFEERRTAILASIEEQGKLTDELRARLAACATKAELEDLYLPYKPKRRTRATIARERGLEPLALRILAQPPDGDPRAEAQAFVNPEKDVADADSALAGARDIVAEKISESPEVRALVRETFSRTGKLVAEAVPEKATGPTKFEAYYSFREPVGSVPSHRYLAIRRGEKEGVLRVGIEVDTEPLVARILERARHSRRSPFAGELELAATDAYERLVSPSVTNDVRGDLKERSELAAAEVFAANLRPLLLAPPLGARSVIGIDPGLRTGCKCAAVGATGKFLEFLAIFPSQGDAAAARARSDLAAFAARHHPFAVGVGNGTAGRETESFARETLAASGLGDVVVVSVSEAGASVYSASEVAREEFPDLDVTVRGAISIARRLQDPLAELVKIEPRSIGVGQYQHDVPAALLEKKLGDVVESAVNHVGVELNTASASLLSYVSGIGKALAKKIVKHREASGPFRGRNTLLEVSGLGPKTFEQAAGFLRVRGGEHPLDASAVHPERYALVERIAADLGVPLSSLVGNAELAARIDVRRYAGEGAGEPTLRDIVQELAKPGRDPRESFEPPRFREDVRELEDLRPGMELEGVITNVAAFGAFVDVGVHQDGLVHVSQLADRFVKDPHEVARVGQKLKVRVLEVDLVRRRIALTARSKAVPGRPERGSATPGKEGKPSAGARGKPERASATPHKETRGKRERAREPRRDRPEREAPDSGPRPVKSSEVLSYRPFEEELRKREKK
ncbi:MAG: RNA-binding transcriptional accessory protein [Planctomycetes bacterium]|nr:RNA-binding transcriptional accessory protein [Planctomycetota bacterium]